MGPDGHTASLFPETAGVAGEVAASGGQLGGETEHQPDLTHAASFERGTASCPSLVGGADKAAVLHEVMEGNAPGEKYPSRLVRPSEGKLIWFVDRRGSQRSVTVGVSRASRGTGISRASRRFLLIPCLAHARKAERDGVSVRIRECPPRLRRAKPYRA